MKIVKYATLGLIILISLFACDRRYSITEAKAEVIELNSENCGEPDEETMKMIEPYKKELGRLFSDTLCINDHFLNKARPDCDLSNFIADVTLDFARKSVNQPVDICLLNYDGLRAEFPVGYITLSDVYKLMPFDNFLTLVTIDKKKFEQLTEYIIRTGGHPIAGFTITSKQGIHQVKFSNSDIALKNEITVATSDYLANGGDHMNFFNSPITRITTTTLIRDIIVENLKNQGKTGKPLHAVYPKRIIIQ